MFEWEVIKEPVEAKKKDVFNNEIIRRLSSPESATISSLNIFLELKVSPFKQTETRNIFNGSLIGKSMPTSNTFHKLFCHHKQLIESDRPKCRFFQRLCLPGSVVINSIVYWLL